MPPPGDAPTQTQTQTPSRCETLKEQALKDIFVQFVRGAMDELGCGTGGGGGGGGGGGDAGAGTGRRGFRVVCEPCGAEAKALGRFVPGVEAEPNTRGVVLCQEVVDDPRVPESLVRRTLLHEFIHAYDDCRVNVDYSNLEHVACTEVRAAMLSGDCDFWTEVQRRNVGFKSQGARCARRRAEISVATNPACASAEQARLAVDAVFERCFQDTAPFLGKF